MTATTILMAETAFCEVVPAAFPFRTAEGALAASRTLTGIGPDPCRNPGADEIVVCGRVTNPYGVPLYTADPNANRRNVRGSAAGNLIEASEAFSSCHARGESCVKPLVVLRMQVGPGKKSGIKIGED